MFCLVVLFVAFVFPVMASESVHYAAFNPALLLWIPLILLVARFAAMVERIGMPSVLGELLAGVVLGNLGLFGIHALEPLISDTVIKFFAEFGVILLLFKIGLESNIPTMLKAGGRATAVACVGVVVPFVLGTFLVGPWLLSSLSFNGWLFVGATLTATSVGITARVFHDLRRGISPEAQIVLGAAVIDDVLGLLILAVVSAVATTGSMDLAQVGWISLKALAFLGLSMAAGIKLAPAICQFLAKIHPGTGMKLAAALAFCLLYSYFAVQVGLAAIVGAFAAGLVLDNVHFRNFDHKEQTVNHLIEPLEQLFVPMFFLLTGMGVSLSVIRLDALWLIVGMTVVAVAGKLVSGLVAGRVNKLVVGVGMVPRGEVGIIFANTGLAIGVVNPEIFAVVVAMVMLTTLITPPALAGLLKKKT